jgi:hypothetical protein
VAFLRCFHALHPAEHSLLLVPKNVLLNWSSEFRQWLPAAATTPGLTAAALIGGAKVTGAEVRRWHATPGACLLMTFENFRNLVLKTGRGGKRKRPGAAADAAPADGAGPSAAPRPPPGEDLVDEVAEMLASGADVVVVDEGHVLRSQKTKLSRAMSCLRTARRLVLTGYPLQNNLMELYAMVSFVDKDVLGADEKDFSRTFAEPILAGQLPGAGPAARRRMNMQLSVLHDLLRRVVDRQGDEQLRRDLPPKTEFVVRLVLTPLQRRLYTAYLEAVARHGRRSLFRDRECLIRLCDRPSAFADYLRLAAAQEAAAQAATAAAATPAAAADAAAALLEAAFEAEAAADEEEGLAAEGGGEAGAPQRQPLPPGVPRELLALLQAGEAAGEALDTAASPKMWALGHLLAHCAAAGEKVVVYAERLATLEAAGKAAARAGAALGRPLRVAQLTGSTTAARRQELVRQLDGGHVDGQLDVLLISKAGSHGINLVAAQAIFLLDETWNPVYAAQAVARIFRYGQARPTRVYRLQYGGALESNVYLRNVNKAALFRRVVDRELLKSVAQPDEDSVDRMSVYEFHPDAAAPVDPAAAARDAAIAALAAADAALPAARRHLAGVDDHDANLAHDESQKLTEEERRAAAAVAYQRAAVVGGVETRGQLRLRRLYPELQRDAAAAADAAALLAAAEQEQAQAQAQAQAQQAQPQPQAQAPRQPKHRAAAGAAAARQVRASSPQAGAAPASPAAAAEDGAVAQLFRGGAERLPEAEVGAAQTPAPAWDEQVVREAQQPQPPQQRQPAAPSGSGAKAVRVWIERAVRQQERQQQQPAEPAQPAPKRQAVQPAAAAPEAGTSSSTAPDAKTLAPPAARPAGDAGGSSPHAKLPEPAAAAGRGAGGSGGSGSGGEVIDLTLEDD